MLPFGNLNGKRKIGIVRFRKYENWWIRWCEGKYVGQRKSDDRRKEDAPSWKNYWHCRFMVKG